MPESVGHAREALQRDFPAHHLHAESKSKKRDSYYWRVYQGGKESVRVLEAINIHMSNTHTHTHSLSLSIFFCPLLLVDHPAQLLWQ